MEFSEGSDVDIKQDFVEMGDKSYQMMIQCSVGVYFVLFVTNWLRNSGEMKWYPGDI